MVHWTSAGAVLQFQAMTTKMTMTQLRVRLAASL
jgi:hypothetical protein